MVGWQRYAVLGADAIDVVEGLDNAPVALDRLFSGANSGNVMAKL